LEQKLKEISKKNEALNLSSGRKKNTTHLQVIDETKEEYKEKTSGAGTVLSIQSGAKPKEE